MKIILLLLSSAVLAILSYGFFRVNVTDFYTYIETLEKPFDEKKILKKKLRIFLFIQKIKKIKKL